ncbi:MAG TPA: rhodanese-like domain-containing protein, partial [Candidatus Limnocylindrales bacterium]|nr:rhodanese-like domain-containing protein [Candidatus Limnocylindrales bacterium]
MRRIAKLLFILLLIGAMMLIAAGCPAEVAPPPANDEPAVEEPVLDPQAVVLDAAKAYFPKVADNNNIIESEKVKEALDADPDAMFILDIRRAEDFELGHIPGSVHSGWGQVGEIMDRIPRDRPVVIACYSGQTSGQTVGILRLAGFENVVSLFYGVRDGWVGKSQFTTEGTGMVAAADLTQVSSPVDEKEEILWEKARAVFTDIAGGNTAIIPPPELKAALDADPNSFYVLDIRRGEDFAAGHIEHSVHSAWAAVGNVLDTLPTDRPIVIACYSGQTAGQTVGVLRM